jgi:hypothetical protein
LVKQLSDQASRLAHLEVELAKAELAAKGKRVGVGIGMFSGAGALAFYGIGVLLAAAVLALATAVAPWLAALIVAMVLVATAGILALQGKTRVQQSVPPLPQQAVESSKEDVRWAKTRAQAARR